MAEAKKSKKGTRLHGNGPAQKNAVPKSFLRKKSLGGGGG